MTNSRRRVANDYEEEDDDEMVVDLSLTHLSFEYSSPFFLFFIVNNILDQNHCILTSPLLNVHIKTSLIYILVLIV